MRKVVGQLVDPIVVQQNNDREDFIKFQHKIHGIDEKVFVLENILFEKDENGRMQLFDRVFDAIKEVD